MKIRLNICYKGDSGMGGGGSRQSARETQKPWREEKGRMIFDRTEEGAKAFVKLSENYVTWNKGADIRAEGELLSKFYKRGQMWDALKQKGMNEFILNIPEAGIKGTGNKALKAMEDYGYYVVAEHPYDGQGTGRTYYMSKKKMQYLGLDLKLKTYYKRGWKG